MDAKHSRKMIVSRHPFPLHTPFLWGNSRIFLNNPTSNQFLILCLEFLMMACMRMARQNLVYAFINT